MVTNFKARKRAPKRMTRYLNSVQLIKGDPTENPFRALRTKGYFELPQFKGSNLTEEVTVGMTLQELADASEISKQGLIRTEQGCFADPPQRIMDYWTIKRGVSYTTLMQGYNKFIKDTRDRHHKLFGDDLPICSDPILIHPLKHLRSHWFNPIDGQLLGPMNITELAKLLCINQSILDYFENHPKKQASVPEPLLVALKDNGYGNTDLHNFHVAYKKFRDNLINPITVEPPVGNQITSKIQWPVGSELSERLK